MSLSADPLVCQDLSVAGKRAGLSGERSGLFMDQIRIIKEMREKDAKSGRTGADIRPRFMVFENVCGIFSCNDGRDFAAVLEETIRVSQPEIPDIYVPVGGWPLSGAYVGTGFSVAWRVLDAQFWGVPQRRRRIALIADFGGQCAPKVLFESSCGFRYIKPRTAQGKGTSGDVAGCTGTSGIECGECRRYRGRDRGTGSGILNAGDPQSKHIIVPSVMQKVYCLDQGGNRNHVGLSEEIAPTLAATHDGAPVVTDTIALEGNGSRESHKGNGYSESDQMYTLNTVEQHSVCYGISAYDSNAMRSDNPHSGVYEADTARTLDLNGGNPACNQGGIAIVEDQTQSAGFCPNMGAKAEGIGYAEEQSPTLRSNGDVGVVYPDVARSLTARNDGSPCIDRGPDVICVEMSSTKNTVSDDGVSPTLTARMGTGGNQVNAVVQENPTSGTFAMQGFGDYIQSDVGSSCKARDFHDATDLVCQGINGNICGTLDSHYYKGQGERGSVERDVVAVDCRNGTENPDINGTLQAKDNGGTSLNLNNVVRQRYVVRRLTPTECARLQGFPDEWLEIGDWYDDNGRLHKDSDSVKYRALGNSIAIPPWLFVLGRLNEYCDDKGMASLFDGISGFPLIWSFLNGKENCVFSSEIDSFCRAVSRIRFPDTGDDSTQNGDTKKMTVCQ